ncbi:MAG: hypothetical protein Q9190_000278 [Brigantiaea leucoxantha]
MENISGELKRQQTLLEDNITRLKKSLEYWQTWEVEYEGLKEEVQKLGDQYIDAELSNAESLSSSLIAAEGKLDASQALSQSHLQDVEGFPPMEIHEELDDNGNIISSTTTPASEAAPQVADMLRQAGTKESPDSKDDGCLHEQLIDVKGEQEFTPSNAFNNIRPPASLDSNALHQDEAKAKSSAPRLRKSVTFTNDTKRTDSTSPQKSAMQSFLAPDKAKAYAEQSGSPRFSPRIPANESPEDVALRREMIQYNMGEVGAVVAEMNIDDDSSEDERTSASFSGSDENEDQFGRTTSRVLGDDYLEEMRTLEKKLNAKAMENVGPGGMIETLLQAEDNLAAKDAGELVKNTNVSASPALEKREVRFAKQLDVESTPRTAMAVFPRQGSDPKTKSSAHTDIIEHQTPASNNIRDTAAPSPKEKLSRFKSDRLAQSRPTDQHAKLATANLPKPAMPESAPSAKTTQAVRGKPSSPAGTTHALKIVEHPYLHDSGDGSASEPDEYDPSLMRQGLSMEYHRMRNRIIQRQGGFLASNGEEDDADAAGPLLDANGKKISRFKAAMINKSAG